jgi:hypothetical protein
MLWNTCGLASKLNNITIKNFSEYHVFGLVETWCLNNTINLMFPNYNLIFSPAIKNSKFGRPKGGLILAIRKYITYKIISQTSDWIIIQTTNPISFYIAICYISPNIIYDNILHHFFEHVKPLTESSFPCLILGDFNARIGNLNNNIPHLPFRYTTDTIINARGRSLDKYLIENSLIVLNGRTKSDAVGNQTFLSSQGASLIDLALTANIDLETIDLKVLNSPDSDHFPIQINIKTDTSKNQILPETNIKPNENHERLQWKIDNKDKFLESLTLPKTEDLNTDQTQKSIKNEIVKAARVAGMIIYPAHKFPIDKPWFDSQLHATRELSIVRLKEFRRTRCHNSRSAYIEAKNNYKKLIITKKNKYFLEINNRIIQSTSPAEFWATIRKFHKKKSKAQNIPINLMYEHYKNIFSTNTIKYPVINNTVQDDPILDNPITIAEVIDTIKNLKFKKSPGLDLIPNEFIKFLPTPFLQALTTLFNNILTYHEFPHDWCGSVIQPIYKNGPINLPSNYRPISLMSTMLKLLTSILNSRLSMWCHSNNSIPEEQAGFRTNYGCMDHIFALHTMIQLKLRFKRRKLYTFFVDLKQAFDSINHSLLISKLNSLGLSSKFTESINALYSSAYAQVRVGNTLSEPFAILNGVLQGEILSPTLFSLFMADYPDILNNSNISGITVGEKEIHSLLYADDIIIVADSIINLQKKINLTKKYFETNRLTINLAKSKIMIFQKGGRHSKKEKWFWGNETIEITKTYKYLGVHFSSSGNFTQHTIKATNKSLLASNSMWPILTKANISTMNTRFKLFDSLVKTVLLYAAPIWAPSQEDLIERIQSNFIRKILHLNPMTPGYILRLETGRRPLSLNIFKNTLRFWFRCMAMPENRTTKQCYLALINTKSNSLRNNWAFKMQETLHSIGLSSVWESQDIEIIKSHLPNILTAYIDATIQNDYDSLTNSTRFSHYKLYKSSLYPEQYLNDPNIPINVVRIFAQARLNLNTLRIKDNIFRLEANCPVCNVEDSIKHRLTECTLYTSFRNHIFPSLTPSNLHIFLNNKSNVFKFCNFIYNIFQDNPLSPLYN